MLIIELYIRKYRLDFDDFFLQKLLFSSIYTVYKEYINKGKNRLMAKPKY